MNFGLHALLMKKPSYGIAGTCIHGLINARQGKRIG